MSPPDRSIVEKFATILVALIIVLFFAGLYGFGKQQESDGPRRPNWILTIATFVVGIVVVCVRVTSTS